MRAKPSAPATTPSCQSASAPARPISGSSGLKAPIEKQLQRLMKQSSAVLLTARASSERDRLDRDEHAGDVGPEADHRPRRLRPGEELRVRLVHFPVEVGPREQYGDLHDAVERAPGTFEDDLDVAQRLTGLLLHRVADDLG